MVDNSAGGSFAALVRDLAGDDVDARAAAAEQLCARAMRPATRPCRS